MLLFRRSELDDRLEELPVWHFEELAFLREFQNDHFFGAVAGETGHAEFEAAGGSIVHCAFYAENDCALDIGHVHAAVIDGKELDLKLFASGFANAEACKFEVFFVGIAGGVGLGKSGRFWIAGARLSTAALAVPDNTGRDDGDSGEGKQCGEPAGNAIGMIVGTDVVNGLWRRWRRRLWDWSYELRLRGRVLRGRVLRRRILRCRRWCL